MIERDNIYMRNRPLVSIIIVTRDRKAEIRKCLQSVFVQNYKNYEVLVIDNQSSDGTVEMLASEFSTVKLICLDRNLGCPGARNVGALNSRGDILFFLDDDCIIDPDAIDNALPYFIADDRLAVITPQIIEPEAGRTVSPRGDSLRYTHDFTGVSAIRRVVFKTFGLYPGDFLYGAEESDLAIRILNGNGRILYAPHVKVFHYPTKNRKPNWEMEQCLQNGIIVLLKYAPLVRLMVGIIVKPLTFLPIAIHKHSLWGWVKASAKIPIMTILFLFSQKRTPLGWRPFLLSEYLINNSISSLEMLSRIEEMDLSVSLYRSIISRGRLFRKVNSL